MRDVQEYIWKIWLEYFALWESSKKISLSSEKHRTLSCKMRIMVHCKCYSSYEAWSSHSNDWVLMLISLVDNLAVFSSKMLTCTKVHDTTTQKTVPESFLAKWKSLTYSQNSWRLLVVYMRDHHSTQFPLIWFQLSLLTFISVFSSDQSLGLLNDCSVHIFWPFVQIPDVTLWYMHHCCSQDE